MSESGVRWIGWWTTLRALWPVGIDGGEWARQVWVLGAGSSATVAGAGALVGAILVLQAAVSVARWRLHELVGWIAAFGVLREVGPLAVGLVFSGRAASRNAAELASMSEGGQLWALRALGLDAAPTVLAPRLWALVASAVVLYGVSALTALTAASVAASLLLDVGPAQFWRAVASRGRVDDLLCGLVKCAVSGVALGLLSTQAGLAASGGAEAVGAAARRAVVRGALAVVVVDLMVSRWFP